MDIKRVTYQLSKDKTTAGVIGLNTGLSSFDPVGNVIEENGKKYQIFKKEMLSVGHYIHPVWEWHLDITEDRLHRFVSTFRQMKENGVDVEVPIDHSLSAADNYGYVVDMSVEKNSRGVLAIFGLHKMLEDEGISLAKRNKNVSVLIERDFVDGKGNHYGEAITHSSIVQQPVVPGQDDFEAVAASIIDKSSLPVLFLSIGEKQMNEEMLKKFRELLGTDDSLTAENALSRLEEHINGLSNQKGELQKQIVDLKAEVDQLKASSKANSTVSIDPNLAEQMGVTAEERLSLLVQKGKITPAVKDKLAASLVGVSGKRNVMALSIGKDGSKSVLSMVIDALQENDPVKLGEQTGAQVLSRQVPGDEKGKDEADEDSFKAMSRGAGVDVKS